MSLHVPGILQHSKPGIADVQCSRLRFEPGDRIIVRSTSRLDSDQQRKLRRSIRKWAGCEVEVLFVCLLDFDVEVQHRGSLKP
jgi:hypothetical protein